MLRARATRDGRWVGQCCARRLAEPPVRQVVYARPGELRRLQPGRPAPQQPGARHHYAGRHAALPGALSSPTLYEYTSPYGYTACPSVRDEPRCSTNTQVVVELAELYRQSLPITLATFWGPLLLLLCGAILAVLVAVAETFYYIRVERVRAPSSHMHTIAVLL